MVKIPGAFESGVGQRQDNRLPTNFQNGNVSADAFGAQVGRDLSAAGKGLNQSFLLAKRVQDEEDKANAYNAYSQASESARGFLNDPEEGLYTKKGSQAMGAYKNSLKGFDDIYHKNAENLSDGAKNRFNELWRTKRERMLEGVSRFEVKERNAFKAQAADATLQTSINDAIENYNNPDFINDSIAIGEVTIRDSMAGAPAEAVKLKVSEFKSGVHSSVINRMALDNSVGAQVYYDKVKDQIDGKQQIAIEKVLAAGNERAASQVKTDQIISKGGTLEEQLKEARKISDPKIRDNVVTRVKQRFAEEETIQSQRLKEVKSEAWKVVLETKSVDAIPIDQWAALDGPTQKSLTEYANRRRNPQTDVRVWKDLNDMYMNDPDAFAEVDILEHINDLSQTDFKKFSEQQQKLLNGDVADSIKVRTYNQIANDRLHSIGIDTGSGASSGDKKQVATFMRALTDEITVFTQQNGKEPNNQQTEDIIDRLLIRDTDGLDSDRLFELDPEDDLFELSDIDDVPPAMRKQAIRAIEGVGAQPTEDNILKLVNEKLKNDRRK